MLGCSNKLAICEPRPVGLIILLKWSGMHHCCVPTTSNKFRIRMPLLSFFGWQCSNNVKKSYFTPKVGYVLGMCIALADQPWWFTFLYWPLAYEVDPPVGTRPGNFSFGSRKLLTNLKIEVIGNWKFKSLWIQREKS